MRRGISLWCGVDDLFVRGLCSWASCGSHFLNEGRANGVSDLESAFFLKSVSVRARD